MQPTKIDKLLALKAVKSKVDEEYKLLEGECRQELLEAYEKDGTDRKTSPYFGPDAGKFSIKRIKGKKPETGVEFNMCDDEALAEWLESNHDAALRYAILNGADFGRYWFYFTGELPEGISRVEYEEPGTPDTLLAQVYSFKPDIVIEKLGGNLLEMTNELLLGDGR